MPEPKPSPPAKPSEINPVFYTWSKGKTIFRVHEQNYGATEFNPVCDRKISEGRFHPFKARKNSAHCIPVIYGADSEEGALAETVFRDIPINGERQVQSLSFKLWNLSIIQCERDLRLISMLDPDILKLKTKRIDLVESGRKQYSVTRKWASMLYSYKDENNCKPDGFIWRSRQNTESRAIILFEPRVPRSTLKGIEPTIPLLNYPTLNDLADRMDITIVP